MRWVGYVASMGKIRNIYKILVGKPEGKRPFRRPGQRWEDNIKIDLKEIGWEHVDLFHLVQNRDLWQDLLVMTMNLQAPKNVGIS
jgi:hypothetical protein